MRGLSFLASQYEIEAGKVYRRLTTVGVGNPKMEEHGNLLELLRAVDFEPDGRVINGCPGKPESIDRRDVISIDLD